MQDSRTSEIHFKRPKLLFGQGPWELYRSWGVSRGYELAKEVKPLPLEPQKPRVSIGIKYVPLTGLDHPQKDESRKSRYANLNPVQPWDPLHNFFQRT